MADDTLWISRPEHIEALASPVRQRILDRLEVLGPCSVRELGASLRVAPDSLYYHVARLREVGLLAIGNRPRKDRRAEALVRLASPRWHIDYDPRDPRKARAVMKVTRTLLRQVERDFASGLRHPRAVARGALRNLWSLRLEGSLRDADVRRINRHLAAILRVLRRAGRDPREGLVSVSWVLAPIDLGPGRGARSVAGRHRRQDRTAARRSSR